MHAQTLGMMVARLRRKLTENEKEARGIFVELRLNDGVSVDGVTVRESDEAAQLRLELPDFININVTSIDQSNAGQLRLNDAGHDALGDDGVVSEAVNACIERCAKAPFELMHAAMVSAHDRFGGDLNQLAVVLIFGRDKDKLLMQCAVQTAAKLYNDRKQHDQPNISMSA